METVIAVGVVAVLLTGFIVVFGPAAQSIKRSINAQMADNLVGALERDLVTVRPDDDDDYFKDKPGFSKGFDYIKESDKEATALVVYQYRGSTSDTRGDGTPDPVEKPTDDEAPGKDYVVTTIMRRIDPNNLEDVFIKDLGALEGPVFLVKTTQLVFDGGELKLGEPGKIKHLPDGSTSLQVASDTDAYSEAVIAFSADFYDLPGRNEAFFTGDGFGKAFNKAGKPLFSRNLAIRR